MIMSRSLEQRHDHQQCIRSYSKHAMRSCQGIAGPLRRSMERIFKQCCSFDILLYGIVYVVGDYALYVHYAWSYFTVPRLLEMER